MEQNLTLALAKYAATTSVEAIPAEVRDRAKQVILDEIASACFGRRSIAGGLAANYVAALGGPGEASVLGTSIRVPAQHAALANGTAGHGEEVDGAHVVNGHPGATLVHAAIAVAERQRASGAELLNAVVLGHDVGVRLVAAGGRKLAMKIRLHIYSDFLFALGAAVAACRLMGLEPRRYCHAAALATFQSNALSCIYQEKRHISKSFCNGQFAYAGVSGALMAAAGFEGVEDVLGTKDGALEAWGADAAAHVVLRDLGNEWSIMGANFKFINAGHPIHAPIEAALQAMQELGVAADEIESVRIGMPEAGLRVVDEREMHNICVQDMVTAALVERGHDLRALPFPGILTNPAFGRLRQRVKAAPDEALTREQPEGMGGTVTIRTIDGRTATCRVDHPRGHSKRGGVTWADLQQKWRQGLPDRDCDRAIALAEKLEHMDDITELVNVFGAPE